MAIGGLTNAAFGPVAPFRMGAVLLSLAIALTFVQLRHQQRDDALALANS